MTDHERLSSHYDEINKLVQKLGHQGDFDAHAASIRQIANTVLFLLEQMNGAKYAIERFADPKVVSADTISQVSGRENPKS